MKCPSCGNDNPTGAAFCDNCGASLVGGAPAGGVPPTAPAVGIPPAPIGGAPTPGGGTCPQCQAVVMPGQAYCENCGFALGSAPPLAGGQPYTPPAPTPVPQYTPPPAAMPPQAQPGMPAYPQPQYGAAMPPARLVMPDGAQIQLAGKTEYMMGREDAVSGSFPDVDLEPHGAQPSGVSRQHAKIVAQGGYFLVDLQSVNGTFLNKQKVVPNQQMPLNNGDEIRLGKLVMNFYTS